MSKIEFEDTFKEVKNSGELASAVALNTGYDNKAALALVEGSVGDVTTVKSADGAGYPWKWAENSDHPDTGTDACGLFVAVGESGAGWERDFNSYIFPSWFGAEGDGIAEDLPATQLAIDSFPHVIFPLGHTFKLTGDLLYNDSQIIDVQDGAVLKCYGGRITPKALGVNNVKFIVNGEISSIGLVGGTTTTTPGKFDWVTLTSPDDGFDYAARAFIEFGGSKAIPSKGLIIEGSGVVHGDFIGSPVQNFGWENYPLKGIMANTCDDVDISGIEVYGFVMEAVQHYEVEEVGVRELVKNSRIHNIYVHDTRFSGVNFNFAMQSEGCYVERNVVDGCRHGIEISGGISRFNTVRNTLLHGISLGGAGIVYDVASVGDIIKNAGDWGMRIFSGSGNVAGTKKARVNGLLIDGAFKGGIIGGRNDIIGSDIEIRDYGQDSGGSLYEAININDESIEPGVSAGTLMGRKIRLDNVRAISSNSGVQKEVPFYSNAEDTLFSGCSLDIDNGTLYEVDKDYGVFPYVDSPRTEYEVLSNPSAANLALSKTYTIRVRPDEVISGADFVRVRAIANFYNVANKTAQGGYAIDTYKATAEGELQESIRVDYLGNLIVGKSGTTSGTQRGTYIARNGTVWTAQPNGGVAQYFQNSGSGSTIGSISHSSASVAYNTTSDKRLKEDLKEFDGLSLIADIDVFDYQWKGTEERAFGVMAQDLYGIFPSAVTEGGDDPSKEPWSVDYSKLVPVLLDAVKKLEARIKELES